MITTQIFDNLLPNIKKDLILITCVVPKKNAKKYYFRKEITGQH